jgi:hypothetical protein
VFEKNAIFYVPLATTPKGDGRNTNHILFQGNRTVLRSLITKALGGFHCTEPVSRCALAEKDGKIWREGKMKRMVFEGLFY